MRTTTTILGAVCALAFGGCCFGGGTPGVTPPPPGTGTTGTTAAGGPMVTLAPGFAPDPMVLSGNAGGPVDATTQGAMCRGYIAAAPNHILNVTAPFPMLRITTSSSIDTTIVIRLSDGRVLCNDDFEGSLNAGVTDMFPIGQHQVWMGSYSMGGSAPYTLNISAAAAVPGIGSILPGLGLGATFPGVPSHCGMAVPDYGPIRIGTSVVLGSHTGWSGPDGRGGYVTEDTWWNDSMWAYVGQRTTVTELAGLDPVGCPYVRTAIDGGSWGWRIRNVTFLGGTGYGAGGYGSVIPTYCGMSYPDYGPLRIGSTVILGAHTEWNGDSWWNDAMWSYVGRTATITEFGGLDPAGCPYVRVNADGGSWGWRIRNLTLIR